MKIPIKQFLDGMHKHQKAVFRAFDGGKCNYFILEWARRHRKTTLAINLLIRECFKNPNSKYVYIAPTQVMARNIVWDDPNMLRAYLPNGVCDLNEQKMLVKFPNGSMLKIGGSDNPDSLRGIDAIGVVFDEWALIKENTWTEIFRPIKAGPVPPHLGDDVFRWAMFLYTPKGVNHATMMFNHAACIGDGGSLPDCGVAEKLLDNWFASRVDGEFAGLMTKDALASAKNDMTPVFYDQEIKCRRVTSEEMTLITSKLLDEAAKRKVYRPYIKRIIAIDTATGGDECCMGLIENGHIVDMDISHETDEMKIAGRAMIFSNEHKCNDFIVATVGVGGGVAGRLKELDKNVQQFKESYASTDERFLNCRAESFWYSKKQLEDNKIDHPGQKWQEVVRQLPYASRFMVANSSGKIKIVPKEQIKKDLGCSPDRAEMWNMGVWGLRNVEPSEGQVIESNISVTIPQFAS